MTTRLSAVVIAVTLAIPTLANARTVFDWQADAIEAGRVVAAQPRGQSVKVPFLQSFQRPSRRGSTPMTGRHRALSFFQQASREAGVAVKNGTVEPYRIMRMRRDAQKFGTPKKEPVVLRAARGRGQMGPTTTATPSTPKRTASSQARPRVRDSALELARRLRDQTSSGNKPVPSKSGPAGSYKGRK
jgi:hypothetical protein